MHDRGPDREHDRGSGISRRRCLTILAGASSPLALAEAAPASRSVHVWRGTAMGTTAKIILAHADEAGARAAAEAVQSEIARLEDILSLYRPGSAIRRLNESGRLDPAPLELLELARKGLWYGQLTHGAFDITVQPLWEVYARHFAEHPTTSEGPPPEAVAEARAAVGFENVAVGPAGLFLRRGARITLNGIAQGYVTDRVAGLLMDRGWRHVLVDLGEPRALAGQPDGRRWRVSLPAGGTFSLSSGAVATSSDQGTRFSPASDTNHLFDPSTGQSAKGPGHVSVFAPLATDADALSTALYVMDCSAWAQVISKVPGARLLSPA